MSDEKMFIWFYMLNRLPPTSVFRFPLTNGWNVSLSIVFDRAAQLDDNVWWILHQPSTNIDTACDLCDLCDLCVCVALLDTFKLTTNKVTNWKHVFYVCWKMCVFSQLQLNII